MTRDELIALARNVGAPEPYTMKGVFSMDGVLLEAFAAALRAESAAPAGVEDEPTRDAWELESDFEHRLNAWHRERALASTPPQSAPGEALRPRTADLVDRFANSLKAKLAAAEKKYGYSDKWANDDWQQECAAKLLEHVAKGDPRDVAAYCAFMWHHDWSTTPTQASWQVSHGAKCPARDGYPCCCEVTQSAPQEASKVEPVADEPVGHLHSNGDFCQTKAVQTDSWPVELYLRPTQQALGDAAKDSYDKVDRFLRNNLDDTDYAEYSEALEAILAAAGGSEK